MENKTDQPSLPSAPPESSPSKKKWEAETALGLTRARYLDWLDCQDDDELFEERQRALARI